MTKRKWWQYAKVIGQQIPVFDIPRDYAESEVKLCKQVGADTLFMFVDLEGEYIFPSKFGPMYAPLKKRDLLKELVTECKENNLRFVAAFMGQHVQTHLSRKHPDWSFKSFKDVKEHGYVTMGPTCLCLNSPYRRVLQGMTREVIEDYGVDGIYYDGIYYPPQFCFCDGCRKKYREMFGKEMPAKLRDHNRIKLGEETVVGWSREIRDLINETNPDVCYALDCHATIIGHSDCREYIEKTYDYVDVRIQECYPEVVNEQPYYGEMECQLMAAETGKTVWWCKWISRIPGRNDVAHPPAAIKLWGAGTLATKSPVFFLLQRTTDIDRACIPPMREIATLWKRARRDMANAETVASVALFHSIESKVRRLPIKVREHRKCFEGWYLALRNEHIPFDVISEVGLCLDALAKYSVLILPNTRYMSEGVIQTVREFVKRGGALIATGFTSLSDENGKDRSNFGLADVFGANYAGVADGNYYGKRIMTQYFRAPAKHPIAKGMDGEFHCLEQGAEFPVVELAGNARPIFRTAGYDEELVKSDRFFVSYPTDELVDTVLSVTEKPHRVVYMPAPLDGEFWEHGWPDFVEIMRNAALWTLKGKSPIETDAEENVWMTLYRNERRKSWILHLNNHGINNQYSIGFDCCFGWDKPDSQSRGHVVRKCFSTAGFSVALKSIRSGKLTAHSLIGTKLKIRKTVGGWTIQHPGISEYDVIVLQES